jgi:hypothetical protein
MSKCINVMALVSLCATACLGGNPEPTAPTRTPDFVVGSTGIGLPGRCGTDAVEERVVGTIEAFNSGQGESFAASFLETEGQLSPYDVGGRGFVGRDAIGAFVTDRHEAGDRWTLAALSPPLGRVGLPREAAYGTDLVVTQKGSGFRRRQGAKVVIDCASGLIRAWVGPAFPPPEGWTGYVPLDTEEQ